jgi:hypothetical protein
MKWIKLTARFQELLKRPQLLVMSGGLSPLHARMSEVLGYEAFFMSCSQVTAYVYGYPDVDLLELNEMVVPPDKPVAPCLPKGGLPTRSRGLPPARQAGRILSKSPRPRPWGKSNGRAPGCALMPPLRSSRRCSRSTDRGAAA